MKKILIGLLILSVFICSGCGGSSSGSKGNDVSDNTNDPVSSEFNPALSVPENVTVTPAGISRKAASATPYNTANIITWDAVDGAISYNIYWLTESPVTTDSGNLIEGVTSPYTHSDLDSNETYYYIVTAVGDSGEEGAPSDEVSSTPIAPPENLTATAGDTSVELTWDDVSGATSYNIYWRNEEGVTTGNGSPFTDVASPYTHLDLSNNTEYYYIVTAVDDAGEGSASDEVSAIPVVELPDAPANPAAAAGDTSIDITWDEVSGATAYNIYWLNAEGVTAGTGNSIAESITTTSYTHSYLTNDLAYYYVITAVDSAGEGAASAEITATPADPVPSVPAGVTATRGNTSNEIIWDEVDGAISYNIYWSYDSDVDAGDTPLTTVTSPYTHSGLTNYTSYYYVVTAVNSTGESSVSAEVSAIPVAPPATVAAIAEDASIELTWATVTGATAYKIHWLNETGVTKGTGNSISDSITINSYTHSNLTNGLAYYYIVTAVDSVGEGIASDEVSASPVLAISSAPLNVTATAGNTSNIITWDSVDGATSYNIYWLDATGVTSATGAPLTDVTSPYRHSDLTNDDPYYYIVTAVNASGTSDDSAEVSATPVNSSEPANVIATPGDASIEISWDDADGAISYNIYRAMTSSVEIVDANRIVATTTTNPYADSTAINDVEYFYIVTAEDGTEESSGSNEVSATAVAVPDAPVINTVTPGNGINVITWDTVTGATFYNIYWVDDGSALTTLTGAPIDSVTSPYTHAGLTNGIEYSYIITAENSSGESAASDEVLSTPVVPLPSDPENLTATPGDGEIFIAWDEVDGATAYNIYRNLSSPVGIIEGNRIAESITANPYTDATAINDTPYFYTVTAENGTGESGGSDEVSATAIAIPDAPVINAVTPGNTINMLTWDAVDGATAYTIYWSDETGVDTGDAPFEDVTSPYTHSLLTNDTVYFYIITAENGSGESLASTEVSGTPVVPLPSVPANVTATPGDMYNTIIWDNVTDATSYTVYWAEATGVTTSSVDKVPDITTNSYTHSGLTNGTEYFYIVTALIDTSEGDASAEVSSIPQVSMPSKPVNVTATPGNTFNTIIWDEADDATSYTIYWAEETGVTTSTVDKIEGITTTSYVHTGLTVDTEYFYIVTSVNSTGESLASDEVSATVLYPNPVTDTGQTDCYDDVGELTACPAEGDDFYGQDGNYSIIPQSYTKLDSNGDVLPFGAASWAMVRDSGTGLTWEVKTDDGGDNDKDISYTWAAAGTFIETLNTTSFGTYSDWRLPTVKELKSIVDNSKSAPSVDDDYFLNTESSHLAYYWSSTEFAKYTDYAWYVHFVYGVADQSHKNNTYNVRAVRGGL